MIETVHRGKLMAQHMRRPVLRNTSANQAVQRPGGGPHHVLADVIVFRLLRRWDLLQSV